MTFKDKVYRIVETNYKLDLSNYDTAGTSIVEDETRAVNGWIRVWTIGERVYVSVNPAEAHLFRDLLIDKPSDFRLMVDDVKAAYPDKVADESRETYYVMDNTKFTPFATPAPYTSRQLMLDDQQAFDAFLARCSEDDKEAGDVSIDPEIGIAYGVLDGEKIIAVASTYEYYGFIDIGILTDSGYRKQGLGKAAVSALCEHFMASNDVLLYRHEDGNYGSRGIARGLNFWQFIKADFVKFKVE